MAQQSIVKEIRRKASSGDFETPVKIGAEQRFVGALLNSHNNNLEEQSILGNDCLTVSWEDANKVKYITKKFYNGDLSSVSSNGYYILFISDYSESEVTAEFYFEEQGLYLPEYDTSKASFQQSGDSIALVGDEPDIYSFDENTGALKINPPFRLFKKEILCLRTNISNTSDTQDISDDILISEKVTVKRFSDDGKIYTKEAITNHLS